MKNLKMLKAVFVILVLSILAGCSDQITSSGETGSSEKGEGVLESNGAKDLPIVQTFKVQFFLKPFKSYKLDVASTGFDRLYSINISDLTVSAEVDKYKKYCQDLLIYSNKLSKEFLSCNSSGFDLSELTIENTSSQAKVLQVEVTGFKQKKDPIKDNEHE